jgi:hypothetical protein
MRLVFKTLGLHEGKQLGRQPTCLDAGSCIRIYGRSRRPAQPSQAHKGASDGDADMQRAYWLTIEAG